MKAIVAPSRLHTVEPERRMRPMKSDALKRG